MGDETNLLPGHWFAIASSREVKKKPLALRRFEKNLVDNGTIILKFFLHVSKDEQKSRFMERIDDKTKNWKFSAADLKERGYWGDYQKAYEQALSKTSKAHAPWFVIPADDKWFTRVAIAGIIHKKFNELELHFPILSKQQQEELGKAREMLMNEA